MSKPNGSLHGLLPRVISAAIAIPLVIVLLYVGSWLLLAGLLIVLALAAYELRFMLRQMHKRPFLSLGYGTAVLCVLAAFPMWFDTRVLLLAVASCLAATLALLLVRRKDLDAAIMDWLATALLPLYLGLPAACFLAVRVIGLSWSLTGLAATWSFDTGAYFVGRLFGRHHMTPRISPKKTWEGFAGGMVVCVAVTILCLHLMHQNTIDGLLLGPALGLAATGGDLFESLIKRRAKVKDSGRIMPGHGGVLDRIDSVLATSVVIFLFVQLFAH